MNLKEAFRYQSFLDDKMESAAGSLMSRDHAFKVTKTHKRKQANPDTEDMVETVDFGKFYPNDDVLRFMQFLVEQRELLSAAISKAKASINLDIDAAVETNKFRQRLSNAVKSMLRYRPRDSKESGADYKFNVEGNQTRYFYDVEVHYEEGYDKEKSKSIMREMIAKADVVSSQIDLAMITTTVEYAPPFDVNESFDDVMEEFIAQYPAQ